MVNIADKFQSAAANTKADWGLSTALQEIGDLFEQKAQREKWEECISYYHAISDNWRASYVADLLDAFCPSQVCSNG